MNKAILPAFPARFRREEPETGVAATRATEQTGLRELLDPIVKQIQKAVLAAEKDSKLSLVEITGLVSALHK